MWYSRAGATWLAGGRIGNYGPEPAYLSLEYGRQQGVYGFTGAVRYSITPTMTFTATLVQWLNSSTQYIQDSLASSTLDPYQSNGSGNGGGAGDVVVNQLILQLSKTF